MSGGLDILIVGVAGENLDHIASDKRLRELFGDTSNDEACADLYVRDFRALVKDPTIANPRIFYLEGEHLCGSQIGVGLGYVLFYGNNNAQPRKLDERVYRRIEDLKQKFIAEVKRRIIEIPQDEVGVYALNVSDT